jgi:uncharacterized iron-regulated membrane protein
MSISRLARLRTLLWTVHRWIGIGLGLLLVPIAASGALLLFKDTLDAQLHPARYAVSGVEAGLFNAIYWKFIERMDLRPPSAAA